MNREKQDPLDRLFNQLPEEPLPLNFRMDVMGRVRKEALRIQKRKERWGLLAVILASLAMLALAIAGFIYLEIPKVSITLPSLKGFPFYTYIGILALLLLGIDYKFRKLYHRKQDES